jgi:hypothetical protein
MELLDIAKEFQVTFVYGIVLVTLILTLHYKL